MDWTHLALELRSKTVIEEKIEGKRRRQRRRKQLRDDLRVRRRSWTLKEEALLHTCWRTHFRKGLSDDGSTVSLPQDVAHLPPSTSLLFSYVHKITMFTEIVQ
jgi:hypothetical protein